MDLILGTTNQQEDLNCLQTVWHPSLLILLVVKNKWKRVQGKEAV